MNEPFEIENQHLQISPSIGIAIYPEAGEDPLSILQHADMAMYEAKIKEKMVALCTRKNCIKTERKARIEKDLPLALVNEEFYLVYQPQIDITTKRLLVLKHYYAGNTHSLVTFRHVSSFQL